MTGDEGQQSSAPPRRGRFFTLSRTITLRQALMAAAAVVVLASGAFGGLASADQSGTATTEPGDTVSVSPFELRIDRARWVDDLGPTIPEPEGRYVALVATLENTSDHPVYASTIAAAVGITGLEGIIDGDGQVTEDGSGVPGQVHVIADSVALSQAQPGLTYEVVFLWDQSAEVDPPETLSYVLRSQTWRQSRIDDQSMWFDPTDTYEGSLEVEPGTEERSR